MNFVEKYEAKAGGSKRNTGTDYAKIAEERKRDFFKFPDGVKTEFIVLWPEGKTDDPLVEYGYHKSLQEVDFYTVPCDAYNKGEECVICNEVENMKEDDLEGNKFLYNPISQRTEVYAQIALLEDDGTWSDKAYWVRLSSSIVKAFVENYKNLEEDETPFYDVNNPMKVVVTLDKTQPPANMYSVLLKNLKKDKQPTKAQRKKWQAQFEHSVHYYFPSRSSQNLTGLLTSYITRKAEEAEQQTKGE